ncbi:MAG: ATP-grasp domain-containing protein [Eubacteriales bacterium]|nr:ATP-grasp domain-containing protein [Eubacteriales bacterium]
MKKLMILGASQSQLPLIQAAKRLGVYTIVASTPGEWPGFAAGDEASYTDISNPEAVLLAAQKGQIDGIATCCLDTGVRAIGYVSENMKLSGPAAEAARIASNKYEMKEAFLRGGVSCAKHFCVHNEAECEEALRKLTFPVVTKAVDLMGSRGIFRSNTPEEARANYKKTMEATGKDYCLIEEFIQGTVFGAEAMVQNGKMVFCMIDNTESFESYVPTPVGHSIPFEGGADLERMAAAEVEKAIRAVGLDNCPVNCDLIRKDGKVYVLEVTGRAGATCLPEITGYRYQTDYYEAIVKLALGEEVSVLFANPRTNAACLAKTLLSTKTGVVKRLENRNDPTNPAIRELSIDIVPGEEVRAYTNGRDRIGQIFVTDDTLSGCRNLLEEVLGKIDIEIE